MKQISPLISVAELKELQENQNDLLIIDCSFDLSDVTSGQKLYMQQHIPKARFMDLDKDLCGQKTAHSGRHPLPEKEQLCERLRNIGLNNTTTVVVYDQGTSMLAAHVWWMLLWLGHQSVGVLDGGLEAWKKTGLTAKGQENQALRGDFDLKPSLVKTVDADFILARLNSPSLLLIDARAPERFRGEVEPLDPVAGHIPGSMNRHFSLNLNSDGTYKSPKTLFEEWEPLIGNHDLSGVVHSCGSGVSACHNLLAMVHAGFGLTPLYAGSWSQWCSYPSNPVAKTGNIW